MQTSVECGHKGWGERISSDIAVSVTGMCVREMDMGEGKGNSRRSGENRGLGRGQRGRGREKGREEAGKKEMGEGGGRTVQ